MTYEQLMVELFQFSSPTYYKWKKHENRPIFDLLDKYFSKEDLEEYVKTGKVSKYEAIENNIFTNHIRTTEILKLFSIVDTVTLKIALRNALKKNVIYCSTIEYLSHPRSKLEVIEKISHFLKGFHAAKLYYESKQSNALVSNPVDHLLSYEENALNEFNDKIAFDFNTEDGVILDNIISRYKVYNTLYGIDDETDLY